MNLACRDARERSGIGKPVAPHALRHAFAVLSSGDRVILDPDTLRRRLLLCLYGLGTNAGLKRGSAGTDGVTHAELQHVRRLFVSKEALRNASATFTSAILAVRDARIWGEAGTACASASKKIGAWDQNLMTEWHVRHNGRGVMIYWHMERRAACMRIPVDREHGFRLIVNINSSRS